MHLLYHALVFTFLLVLGCEASPKVVSSEYQINYLDMLSTKLTYGLVNVTLDDDVYIVNSVQCGPAPCITIDPEACPPCDYTHSNGGCGVSPKSGCTCERAEELCTPGPAKPENTWHDIKANSNITFTVHANVFAFVRYFHDKPCDGFKVRIQNKVDIVRSLYSWRTPLNEVTFYPDDPDRAAVVYTYPQEPSFCPGDHDIKFFDVGTLFMTFFTQSFDTEVTIFLDSGEIPTSPPDSSSDAITAAAATVAESHPDFHQIIDGVSVDATVMESDIYYYVIDKCQVVSFRATVASSVVDVDMFISFNADTLLTAADYSLMRFGEEYITLSLCPDEGHTTKVVYIAISGGETWYRLSVTSTAPTFLIPMTQGYPRTKAYELMGAISLDMGEAGQATCSGFHQCKGVYGVYPAKNPDTLSPLPYFLDSVGPSDLAGVEFNTAIDTIPASKTIQAVVVLRWDSAGIVRTPVKGDGFPKAIVKFSHKLVGADKLPIKGGMGLTRQAAHCDFTQYAIVRDKIQDLLTRIQDVTDELTIRQYRFNIDSLMQFNAWSNCQDMVYKFVEVVETTRYVMDTSCVLDPASDEWAEDPCCNPTLKLFMCCQPTMKPSTSLAFTGNKFENAIAGQCASPECSAELSVEYARVYSRIDKCNSAGQLFNTEKGKIYTIIRSCSVSVLDKKQFCTDDVQCTYNGTTINGAYCDLMTHQCSYPFEYIGTQYLKCIIENIHGGALIQLETLLGLPPTVLKEDLVNTFKNYVTKPDCMPTLTGFDNTDSLSERMHYSLDNRGGCPPDAGCVPYYCKDETCEIPPLTTCDDYCYRSWLPKTTNEATCNAGEKYCNWASCEGLSNDNCTDLCNTGPETYCGVCVNPVTCPEVVLPDAETTCADLNGAKGYTCLLPDGTVSIVATEADCTSQGTCSLPCGGCASSSYSAGVCVLSGVTADDCNATYSGIYDDVASLCLVPGFNQSTCTATTGGSWSACDSSLPRDQCTGGPEYLACAWDFNVPCANQQACVAFGGACTDTHYIPAAGACVLPRRTEFDGYHFSYCDESIGQVVAPSGCVDRTINRTACEAAGHTWSTPTYTPQDCAVGHGCYEVTELDLVGTSFIRLFTQKDEANCMACDTGSSEWKNFYEWEEARWIPGKIVRPAIIPKTLATRHAWTQTISYNDVQTILLQTVANLSTTAYQIEALCKFNKLKDTLTNLVCDCSQSGQVNGTCYENNPLTLDSLVRLCAGEESSMVFSTSNTDLTFPVGSVDTGCAEMLVYDISSQLFKGQQPIRLASYFAAFEQKDLYSVKNQAGGDIGVVIGDGIVLSSNSNTKGVEVCVSITQTTAANHDFNVLDLSQSSYPYDYVVPLEVKAYTKEDKLCAIVDIPIGDTSIIPILRIKEWRSVTEAYFALATTQLFYTLGVAYVLIAGFAFVQLAAVFILRILERGSRFQISTIITLALFVYPAIRCIYFFSVPSGVLSEGGPVVEYILIVFPTFPYFTAFSFVPIVWALLTSASLQREHSSTSRMIKFVGVINFILYLLFMIIVLVFNFATDITTTECLGHVIEHAEQSTAQIAISIVYSVAVATVSLALSVSFIYFGRKAALMPQNSSAVMKTYRIAVVCSVGFGLNCIFIIIITSSQVNSVGLSFAGLIITEIIPTIFMLTSFGSLGTLKLLLFGRKKSASSLGSLSSVSVNTTDSDSNSL